MIEFLIVFVASMAGSVTVAIADKWYTWRVIRQFFRANPLPREEPFDRAAYFEAGMQVAFQAAKPPIPSAHDDDRRGIPPLIGPQQDEIGGNFS